MSSNIDNLQTSIKWKLHLQAKNSTKIPYIVLAKVKIKKQTI
jgi:hypothetical protein